jgi:hypothetical protein
MQLSMLFLTSNNLPLDYSPPNIVVPLAETAGHSSRRHWVITRNLTRRGKEKDNDPEISEGLDSRYLREAHALDFGSFALLAGALEEDMHQRVFLLKVFLLKKATTRPKSLTCYGGACFSRLLLPGTICRDHLQSS